MDFFMQKTGEKNRTTIVFSNRLNRVQAKLNSVSMPLPLFQLFTIAGHWKVEARPVRGVCTGHQPAQHGARCHPQELRLCLLTGRGTCPRQLYVCQVD